MSEPIGNPTPAPSANLGDAPERAPLEDFSPEANPAPSADPGEQESRPPDQPVEPPPPMPGRVVAECPKHGLVAADCRMEHLVLLGQRLDLPCPHCLAEALAALGVETVTYRAI